MCDTLLTPEEIKEQARKETKKRCDRRWRAANKERRAAKARAWYLRNKEKNNLQAKEWAKANPERVKLHREKRKLSGKDALDSRAWREKNPEKMAAAVRRWSKANPEKMAQNQHSYRAKKRGNPLNNKTYVLRKFIKDQKVPCHYCNAEWEPGFHVDHFLPISAGAPEADWNLRSSCASCNLSKNAKLPWNFMQQSNLNYYDEQNCTGKTCTGKEKETQTNEKEIRAGYTSPSLECRERTDECNCNCSTNESRSAGD